MKSVEFKKKMVLGAGMAGLGAYYADNSIEIFEAENYAGGLCSGFEIEGFQFDKAVHLSFSKVNLVKDIFAGVSHQIHYPTPISWYHGKWLKHPAQNNLFPLSAREKVEAVKGFINRDLYPDDSNFSSWTKSRYGEYLWKHLFEPYNKKYWCANLDEMDINWINYRIYQPDLEEMLYGTYTDKTPVTYYAPKVLYPKRGGYYSFVREITESAERTGKIHYGKRAVRIDIEQKRVLFEDGTECRYEKLYTSLPLPELIRMIAQVPDKFIESSWKLENTGIAIISFGIKKTKLNSIWFYIYDSDIMAARAYMPSEKSKYNVPEGFSSIQFEIYFNAKKNPPDENTCYENCIYAMEKIGICNKSDIVVKDYRILKYGNVIFKHGTEQIVKEMIQWLEHKGIKSIGRFGRWEYLWSDQAFMSGYNAVMKI